MIVASAHQRQAYRRSGHWGDTTLAQRFAANVAQFPQREAVVDPSNRADFTFGTPRRLTFSQLNDEVQRIAAALIEQGLGKDDVVFVQLPNIVELLAMYFACAEIGAIISPIPVVYREHELASLQASIAPKAYVFAHSKNSFDFLAAARKVFAPELPLLAFGEIDDGSVGNLSTYSPKADVLTEKTRPLINADDVITLCWTSGTTGTPKAVPRSHNHWLAIAPITTAAAGLQPGDVLLNPFPMVNMGAIGGVIMSWLLGAGTIVLHHPFDLGVFMQQIQQERPHFTLAPPAILNMLLANPELAQHFNDSSLRSIASGSAPLAPTMIRGFQERFGIGIVNVFGSNEGMSMASGPSNVADPDLRASYFPAHTQYPTLYAPATAADACAHIQMRIVDVESRVPIVSDGRAGELEIVGPTVFAGYLKTGESPATNNPFTVDGYFKTGDLFEYAHAQQQLKFVGRCKDLIIRGGVNIAPEEIDQLLGGHPDIVEACAFGVPHAILGEKVAVAVVARPDVKLELADVTQFLAERGVAKQKWPEFLVQRNALPRNAMNKVLRQAVSVAVIAELGLEDL